MLHVKKIRVVRRLAGRLFRTKMCCLWILKISDWDKIFQLKYIRNAVFGAESDRNGTVTVLLVGIVLTLKAIRPVVEVDALHVVKDSGESFEDVGFAAAVSASKAVGVKLVETIPVPLAEEMNLEACGEASERDTELETKQLHGRG
jgi:hypothetical protein